MELSNPKNKNFRRELSSLEPRFVNFKRKLEKPENKNFFYFFSHFLFVERELFKHKRKRNKFPVLLL